MKVLLVCGSPNEHGCTYTALEEVGAALREDGIQADHFWIGKKPLSGCLGCGKCYEMKRCVLHDKVNEFTELAKEYDGFVFGAPVHFSGPAGAMMSFLDRVFYSSSRMTPHPLRFKPAAAIVSARRAGTTSALDQMNKYLLYSQMPIATSRYWNMVHGNTPEEVKQDEEGLQIMQTLGHNLAWLLKLKEAGEKAGVPLPKQPDPRILTNFIR